MPTRRSEKPRRDRKAHFAINALAAKVAEAQAHDTPIVLVLRTRDKRRLKGTVESRRIDPRKVLRGHDGESNLLVKIAGEEIPLEHVAEIRRQRSS